ncbi:MAG: type I-D CRISPR-associated protein Cas10d/Csc3 [Pseudanabaenaceae cyanobacterium SKYGB_i_bin29]|nr:type I-D CRISPR-associated protein Cas10d/Csc3 [Pseudanabaenaceae cyanobacterium SKYG29]MDW8420993.1 type I-D CRISPR-associated protein Cas10d/Csc3 [Pseudanabaenaceae cyanobacterium SKYGB_i_bin29]
MTLLQSLLLKTIDPKEQVLREFVQVVLPHVESEFTSVLALGGSYDYHLNKLQKKYGHKKTDQEIAEIARSYSNRPEQSLLFHVLNGLMIAWNLSKQLDEPLVEEEQRLLCLAMILHDYTKYLYHQEVEEQIRAEQVKDIITTCQTLGDKLHFSDFWQDWHTYLPDIAYLAQNTQAKIGANCIGSNWQKIAKFGWDDRRLDNPLCHLLGFGDIAVHLQNPAEIITNTIGQRLNDRLKALGIDRRLTYHRLRDTRGIITNIVHNQVLSYLIERDYEPLIFLAQGVVYLSPLSESKVGKEEIKQMIWQTISDKLERKFADGETGFERDGKGLKCAPLVKELLAPQSLIRCLPQILERRITNVKDPATKKRLAKMEIPLSEKNELEKYADIRSDRVAEFIIFLQREIFSNQPKFTKTVLDFLGLSKQFKEEDAQVGSGGVNYGWYRIAAHYIRQNASLDDQQVQSRLANLAENITNLLDQKLATEELTKQELNQYLDNYLEVLNITSPNMVFTQELRNYTISKQGNNYLCSLSSGEFLGVEQMDTVVLFKPQQYSNKNPLGAGSGRLKRGICRIWALEMLLRQSYWTNTKQVKDGNPVFLYLYPAYTYSPQLTKAIRVLVFEFSHVNTFDMYKNWINNNHSISSIVQGLEMNEEGKISNEYSKHDLPFLAVIPWTNRSDTLSGTWIEPILRALALPISLGIKVVLSSSQIPLYNSDSELQEYVIVDGGAGFINLLGYNVNLSLARIPNALTQLLTIYAIHTENRNRGKGNLCDNIVKTTRECVTDVLSVFSIAKEGLRNSKRETHSKEEVSRIWRYAEMWSMNGDVAMQEKLKATSLVAEKMFAFYLAKPSDKSYTLLLPFNKLLDLILSVPDTWDDEELVNQGTGQLIKAIDRQEISKRPLLHKDEQISFPERRKLEEEKVQEFVQVCITEIFRKMCQGDRALLQEHRNRLRDGVEFAYKRLLYSQKESAIEPEKAN